MNDQLPEITPDRPRVIIAQRVIDKIIQGALLYLEPETGEAMIGLVMPQNGRFEPDIYVLDTVSAGEHAVREWGLFEQGDDWQGDVLQWLHVNWEAFRDLRRSSYGKAVAAKWNAPLTHVGDWHKHPGDMTFTSGGDLRTARSLISDAETPVEHLVAPIVTMYPLNQKADVIETQPELAAVEPPAPKAKEKLPANVMIKDLEDKGWQIRIDFYYISKRRQNFVPITPVVWTNDRLPGLPAIAWYLEHPKRFDQERSLLQEAGYAVDIVRWDADGRPPYEICFSIYKPGSQQVIILVTTVDYPNQMPAIRLAPLVNVAEGEDIFEKLYDASQSVPMTQMPEWSWDSKRTLIELVWHIEKAAKKDAKS
ncbi:MAG: hypothetical protein HY866_06135 [Chloroflexi bacterium]|nr:hypothetical protein [Chloroflexota bacterium]